MTAAGIENPPEPSNETVRRLAVNAGKYLGKEAGDPLPSQELRQQAKANGYQDQEIDGLLEDAGVREANTVRIPEQGNLFGDLWSQGSEPAGADSPPEADNIGATAENGCHDNDTREWENRPTSSAGGCHPEPLDDEENDCYALQEPIATEPTVVDKQRYLSDNGNPMTHFDAIGSYIELRHGESTTETRYGWGKGRQYHAKQQYRRGMAIDRQLLAEYDNPTTVLLSLRMTPTVDGRLTLLTALKTAAKATINQIRYRLQNAPDAPFSADEWEYIAVYAGTKKRATPHLHIYLWIDGDLERERLDPVVEKFVNQCDFTPEDGAGNDPNRGAVQIRGNGKDAVPRTDESTLDTANYVYEGKNSQGAVYVLTQLPHLRNVDQMAQDELLHSATIDAWSGSPYSSSVSDSDVDDRYLAVAPM